MDLTNANVPQPTLHKPVPMGARVVIPALYVGEVRHGTVVGIGFVHIVFSYIVLLDEPVNTPYGTMRAIPVVGGDLTGEDGSNWRL